MVRGLGGTTPGSAPLTACQLNLGFSECMRLRVCLGVHAMHMHDNARAHECALHAHAHAPDLCVPSEAHTHAHARTHTLGHTLSTLSALTFYAAGQVEAELLSGTRGSL